MFAYGRQQFAAGFELVCECLWQFSWSRVKMIRSKGAFSGHPW